MKILLGVIALLLAVIAFRPYVDGVPTVQAQIGSGTGGGGNTVFRTELVNRVLFADNIVGVEVMDSNNVFLVHTAKSVEVYRVDDLPY